MINKIKKLYPNYIIVIEKNGILYGLDNNIIDIVILQENNYILLKDDYYEVHKNKRP